MVSHDSKYEVFTWGPHLFKGKVPEEVRLELIERSKNSKLPANYLLASIIDDVRGLEEEDKNWLEVSLRPLINQYMESIQKREAETEVRMNLPNFTGVKLHSAWVNYQKQYEVNPEHIHGGDVSFSIYLNIPDKLIKEQGAHTGSGFGPGAIGFRYGERSNLNVFVKRFLPEEGDILMFPSSLHHWVVPFRSDCVRVSVAGNLHFI